jgi:hypothetical protein
MVKKFNEGPSKYIISIITRDETWIYYTQSEQWMFDDEETPNQERQSKSVGKRMFAVIFSKRGLVEAIMLGNKKTVTTPDILILPKVFESLKNIHLNSRMNTWFLNQDNAPAHRAPKTNEFFF